jgi:hypothetical protein
MRMGRRGCGKQKQNNQGGERARLDVDRRTTVRDVLLGRGVVVLLKDKEGKMMKELIDLKRIIDVLTGYGADKEKGTPAREALDQLNRCCRFHLGDKILLKEDGSENGWSRGVVVCYMLHEACFVVGPGDKREPLPKDATLWGVPVDKLLPRDALPHGAKIVPWKQSKRARCESTQATSGECD